MKYTIEQLKEKSKVAVYLDTEEEWNKFKEHFNTTENYKGQHYYNLQRTYSGSSDRNYAGAYDVKGYIHINFDQIIFEETVNNFPIY